MLSRLTAGNQEEEAGIDQYFAVRIIRLLSTRGPVAAPSTVTLMVVTKVAATLAAMPRRHHSLPGLSQPSTHLASRLPARPWRYGEARQGPGSWLPSPCSASSQLTHSIR